MRKIIVLITVCLAIPGEMEDSDAAIVNSGFENHPEDPSPWVEYGDAHDGDPENVFRVYSAPRWGLEEAHGGNRVYGVVSFFPHYQGGIHGTVTGLEPGVYYEAGVYIYCHNADAGASTARIGADPSALGDPQSASVGYGSFLRSEDSWELLRFRFTATRSSATLILTLSLHGEGGQEVFVDDVQIAPAADRTSRCVSAPNRLVSLPDLLVEREDGKEAYCSAPASHVITGLGFRAWFQDVTTARARLRRVYPDGTLGNPMEVRGGYEPDAGLEVNVDLPDCYVMVGFGIRAAYETDLTTMAVWGRPILADGTLGPVEEFRSGSLPDHSLEMQHMVEDGRVITGAGVRVSNGDVTGLFVESRVFSSRITGDEAYFLGR